MSRLFCNYLLKRAAGSVWGDATKALIMPTLKAVGMSLPILGVSALPVIKTKIGRRAIKDDNGNYVLDANGNKTYTPAHYERVPIVQAAAQNFAEGVSNGVTNGAVNLVRHAPQQILEAAEENAPKFKKVLKTYTTTANEGLADLGKGAGAGASAGMGLFWDQMKPWVYRFGAPAIGAGGFGLAANFLGQHLFPNSKLLQFLTTGAGTGIGALAGLHFADAFGPRATSASDTAKAIKNKYKTKIAAKKAAKTAAKTANTQM